MDEQNPYKSPASQVMALPGDDMTAAGRWVRLGAALIDGIIAMVVTLPLMYVGGYFTEVFAAAQQGRQVGFGLVLVWTLIVFVIIAAIQAYPLHATGQTWGKRVVKVKIVDLAGNKPPLLRLLALRMLPISLVSAIPFIGGLLTVVDALLIFRNDRRCGHDLIAGTRVVPAG
ncbi:RDD family protein [Luteimonas aquatica]|uniref:RDD family protein n=1 Tax=Luteimonas aquatica TaxID=450364 RepID=UPI001F5831B9|nr:RDD family protein [Luteimonas aquatica]